MSEESLFLYIQKRGVSVGADSVKKKLVIQWFTEVNLTELMVRGNKQKEEKRHGRYHTLGSWDYSIY